MNSGTKTEKFDIENLKSCYLYIAPDESPLLDKMEEIKDFLKDKLNFDTDFMEFDFSREVPEEQFENFITMPSLFSVRKIIMINNTDKAPVRLQKKIAEIISASGRDSQIIFFLTLARGKLLPALMKEIKRLNTIKNLKKSRPSDLRKWLDSRTSADGIEFLEDAREQLIENVNADLNLLKREYGKLSDYISSEDKKIITADMVDSLVSRVYSLKIFDLVDFLGRRDKTGSLKALNSVMEEEQNPIGLVTLIHRMFKSMLYIKSESGRSSVTNYIENYSSTPPYFVGKLVSKYIRFSENYTREEIIRIFEILNKYDISFRSGVTGDKNLVKMMISQIVDVKA